MNFTQKLLEYINGLDEKEAAKRFNRTVQAVRIWKATGNVPLVIVQQIMDETNGLETPPIGVLDESVPSPNLISSPRTGLINEDAVPIDHGTEIQSTMHPLEQRGVPVDSASYIPLPTNIDTVITEVRQRLDKLEAFARMMTDPDRVQSSDVRPASPQVQVPIVSGVTQSTTEIPAQCAPVYTANAPSTFIEQHVEASENPNGVGAGWNIPYPRDNRR